MTLPLRWNWKRPGQLIPVFFLSLLSAPAQTVWQTAPISGIGGCYTCLTGSSCPMYNQAGLGWDNPGSLSFHHVAPFSLNQIGISGIGWQVESERGKIGTSIITHGLRGLRKSDLWFSFGTSLSPRITAGTGIHLWTSSVPGRAFYHPGFSCALGLQVRVTPQLIFGVHVLHPIHWSSQESGGIFVTQSLSSGMKYTFFNTATTYTEFQANPQRGLSIHQGLELFLPGGLKILAGFHTRPYTFSGGFSLHWKKWDIHITGRYVLSTGITPAISLTYAR